MWKILVLRMEKGVAWLEKKESQGLGRGLGLGEFFFFFFVFKYLILFGIHHSDLIVTEIQYRIFFFLIISQLHKDNNTAVEDQRGKNDIFIYNSLYCKHLIYILLLTYNESFT